MTTAEAKGYIRAHAGRIVALQTDLLLMELAMSKKFAPELTALARRRVVALVLTDLIKLRRTLDVQHRAA
jgi:hypothetical protein